MDGRRGCHGDRFHMLRVWVLFAVWTTAGGSWIGYTAGRVLFPDEPRPADRIPPQDLPVPAAIGPEHKGG